MIIFNKLILWFGSNIFKLILLLIGLFFSFIIVNIFIPLIEFLNYFFNSFNEFQDLNYKVENFFEELRWERIETPNDESRDSKSL